MNTAAGVVLGVVLQAAVVVAVIGVLARCWCWARAPLPRAMPLTPAPASRLGVVLRVLAEVALFTSLWRATRTGWLLGWTFHAALVVVLVDHLWLVLEPVPAALWRLHAVTVPVGAVLLAALVGLAVRRAALARVRLVSAPSDYLHLALLGGLAASGLALRTWTPVDIGAVRRFARGLLGVEWAALAPDPMLVAHIAGAALLLVVFPFSKLMHAPAAAFSASLAGRDGARRRR